ncbi:glycogen synthase GlgA [Bacteroidota bacterium]
MKIAYVSSEVFPFAKTGGLADVAGSLPKEISQLGHDIKVFMPKYYPVDEKRFSLEYQSWMNPIPIRVSGITRNVFIQKSNIPESKVEIYFVDFPAYFHRENIYTNDHDEADRFILFSKAVLEIIQRLQWKPDVVHCNDWQTGLIPLYIKDNYNWDKIFHNVATLFTIHNIGYQGKFGKETLDKAEIKHEYFYNFGEVKHEGNLNFLKAGISFADVINTVSETYAKELLTPEYSSGLDYVLDYRSHDLHGVLNGIDYNIWNPRSDKHLPYHYSPDDLSGKIMNKKFLLDKFSLPYNPNIPLIGIISRLVIQKGFDLIARSLNYLVNLNAQWIILGSGEDYYEDMFETLANYRSNKVACYIGYNNELSHLIEAGADIFLMPSHYEPCGLNQIYSLKYGAVPIVRKTGGLADTVQDWDEFSGYGYNIGNGFSFHDYNGFALTNAVERAIKYFHNKPVWETIIKNGMARDYSWQKSAEKYLDLYNKAISKIN